MVLGSAMDGKSAILLYESKDMEHWEYAHPLLLEDREKIRCFECPDFMELDGKYAAIGAWMEHRDEGGRYQMSRYYIGNWQDRKLEITGEGWFDFGSNCYACRALNIRADGSASGGFRIFMMSIWSMKMAHMAV